MSGFLHLPVMLNECVELLSIKPGGIYVDGTLGGGGHTMHMLERGARVIGIDRDEAALDAARARLAKYAQDGNFIAVHANFCDIADVLDRLGEDRVGGVLLDLGVSSHQLDTPERGFSFHNDAPLDMRMDRSQGITAHDVINGYSEKEIARILYEYGEERWAARIAKFIVEARPLETTMDLVRVIDAAVPASARREVSHPARRSFQAVRIEVNGELSSLEKALDSAMSRLCTGGRLAVITFHSLEDRIVKNAMRRMEKPCDCPPKIPVCICGKKPYAKVITRHAVLPSEREREGNRRARSAKLRVAEHV